MSFNEADIQALLQSAFPLYQHIGLVVESASDGVYRCRVPLAAQNVNHLNTVHAALQWAVAEVLGGIVVIATFGPEQLPYIFGAVRSANIEFLRPARTDVVAETTLSVAESDRLRASIAAGESADFELHSHIRSTSGETVATMHATFVVRPQRTRPENP